MMQSRLPPAGSALFNLSLSPSLRLLGWKPATDHPGRSRENETRDRDAAAAEEEGAEMGVGPARETPTLATA